jgi:hypothetical protein
MLSSSIKRILFTPSFPNELLTSKAWAAFAGLSGPNSHVSETSAEEHKNEVSRLARISTQLT